MLRGLTTDNCSADLQILSPVDLNIYCKYKVRSPTAELVTAQVHPARMPFVELDHKGSNAALLVQVLGSKLVAGHCTCPAVGDAAIDYGQIQAVVAAMEPVLCRRLALDCLLVCSMVAVAVPRKPGSCSTSDEGLPVPAAEGT